MLTAATLHDLSGWVASHGRADVCSSLHYPHRSVPGVTVTRNHSIITAIVDVLSRTREAPRHRSTCSPAQSPEAAAVAGMRGLFSAACSGGEWCGDAVVQE